MNGLENVLTNLKLELKTRNEIRYRKVHLAIKLISNTISHRYSEYGGEITVKLEPKFWGMTGKRVIFKAPAMNIRIPHPTSLVCGLLNSYRYQTSLAVVGSVHKWDVFGKEHAMPNLWEMTQIDEIVVFQMPLTLKILFKVRLLERPTNIPSKVYH
jgi:hypothetical protein